RPPTRPAIPGTSIQSSVTTLVQRSSALHRDIIWAWYYPGITESLPDRILKDDGVSHGRHHPQRAWRLFAIAAGAADAEGAGFAGRPAPSHRGFAARGSC